MTTSESQVHRRQILRYKVDYRTEIVKNIIMVVDPDIGIQMERKELTKTYTVISN